MRLKNKVAIITGGGSGIGAAAAELFAEEGTKVLVVDRDADHAHTIAQLIGAASFSSVVSDEKQVIAMAKYADDTFGRVDILVNNAGYGIRGSVTETHVGD